MIKSQIRSRDRDATTLYKTDVDDAKKFVARQELQRKCCFIRLQYHPVSRVLFEVVWRLMFVTDLVTDVSLCLQFTPFTTLWCLFVAAFSIPYILSSVVLFLPFHRRLLSNHRCATPLGRALMLISLLLIYAVLSVPCILLLDLYICTVLITTDLATTRYLLYYWRLKLLVEQTFEAIPQTVLLILVGSGILEHSTSEQINVHLLYGSLSISTMCLLWYVHFDEYHHSECAVLFVLSQPGTAW